MVYYFSGVNNKWKKMIYMGYMEEQAQEKEEKRINYLIQHKHYRECMECGNLIAPGEEGYDVYMCKESQEEQMKD